MKGNDVLEENGTNGRFPAVQLPVIGTGQMKVTAYADREGRLHSAALNEAIRKLSETGGGRVTVPAGLWRSGPIRLCSHVELHLERGALVVFEYSREEYPLIRTSYEGSDRIRAVSPVSAADANDIAITGEGILDGSGHKWRVVKKDKMTSGQWNALISSGGITEGNVWFPSESSRDGHRNPDIRPDEEDALNRAEAYYDYYRPVMVSLVRCRRVLLKGVTFQNSPAWNLHPLFCGDLTIDGVTVRNPWYAQNGDGLDLESCRNVLIRDSNFDVGDDAICMKSGKNAEGRSVPGPTEFVTIEGCTVYHGHGGFVVGSEMSRGVTHIRVKNCTFIGTDIGIRFKSTLGRGGTVEAIRLEQIRMIDIKKEAILFSMQYGGAMRGTPAREDIPEFKNIVLKDIVCLGAETAFRAAGLPELPIHDILLMDSSIRAKKGIFCENGKNIRFQNVELTETREDGGTSGEEKKYFPDNRIDDIQQTSKDSPIL